MAVTTRERSALVTGAGSGIGRAVARRLARRGYAVTVVDVDATAAARVAEELERGGASASTARADIAESAQLERVFASHVKRYGGVDVVVNNAGVGDGDGSIAAADTAVKVNLAAVIAGTKLAEAAMAAQPAAAAPNSGGRSGTVVNVASTGGLWPMPHAPVYAATKAAVLMYTRSAAERLLASSGVVCCALAPTYTKDTGMGDIIMAHPDGAAHVREATRGAGLAKLSHVVDAVEALVDGGQPGQALVCVPGQHLTWQWSARKDKASAGRRRERAPPPQLLAPLPALPTTRRVLMVKKLTTDFKSAVELVEEPMPAVSGTDVLVARCHVGVNASDVNFTAGRYFGKKAVQMLPFPSGLESVGYVAAVGEGALKAGVRVGQCVSTLEYGAFSTHGVVDCMRLLPCLAPPTPEALALLTSGLTASLALERSAGLRPVGERGQRRKKVLVTAAAGGTGQFAVQLARLMGHEVIATCGSDDKARLLRELGAHRVINYRRESVGDVLKREYNKGVDVIFESVGGEMFDTVTRHVAPGATVIVIGMMSAYQGAGGDAGGWPLSSHAGLTERLLWTGAKCVGFFLLQHAAHYKRHLGQLQALLRSGVLRVATDTERFEGIEGIPAAVERLQSGRSAGKVTVQLAHPPPAAGTAKL